MTKKTIGILGGMGPLATTDLFRKIVLHTNASTDQDHLHIIIDDNTNIPDRTAALLYGGTDPRPEMIKSAKMLVEDGADCLLMPCNTAHNYYESVQQSVSIKILNMIELTCDAMKKKGIHCAGLLATTGTIKTEIYQRYCQVNEIDLVIPPNMYQEVVMDMIYKGVKAGKSDYDTKKATEAIGDIMHRGAQAIVLGCTELPLAMDMYLLDFPAVDPTLELAKAAIVFAGGKEMLKNKP